MHVEHCISQTSSTLLHQTSFCRDHLPCSLSFSAFSLSCTQGFCEFWGWVLRAWVLCQVHFRKICPLLDCQYTRAMSLLSLAHCNCSGGICRKLPFLEGSGLGSRVSWAIREGSGGSQAWCLGSAAARELPGWWQCLLKAVLLPRQVQLFAHSLGILAGCKITTYVSSSSFLCVFSPTQDMAFYKIL